MLTLQIFHIVLFHGLTADGAVLTRQINAYHKLIAVQTLAAQQTVFCVTRQFVQCMSTMHRSHRLCGHCSVTNDALVTGSAKIKLYKLSTFYVTILPFTKTISILIVSSQTIKIIVSFVIVVIIWPPT